jgi:transposase
MADIARKTKRYPSDLTDEEWERIAPLLPRPAKKGRKPEVDLREVSNAIRYMARSGGGWRMLPRDFPPWQTVYWWFGFSWSISRRRTSPTAPVRKSS